MKYGLLITITRYEARRAVKMAKLIIKESYYRNNPPKERPFKDALLILLGVSGIAVLLSKPVNPFEANGAEFNLPKPVALNTLKDPNR